MNAPRAVRARRQMMNAKRTVKSFPSLLAAAFTAIALQVTGAAAQAQPVASRPVRIIVPFLGGSVDDSVARVVVRKLGETARQPFAVENHPGDDAHFGAERAAKTDPDGYTLLFAPITNYAATAASARGTLHYDLRADFTPVTLIANAPHVLIAHPSLRVNSVAALIAAEKARPRLIPWASPGTGSLSQLELEMFAMLSGIGMVRVPFSDADAVLPELLVGNVGVLFDNIAATLPHIREGRMRALAVAGSTRSPALPGVPTVAASGLAGFEADRWYAMLAPEGVEAPVVNRLNDNFAKALDAGDVRGGLLPFGFEARRSTPAELAAILRNDVARWARVIKASGLNVR